MGIYTRSRTQKSLLALCFASLSVVRPSTNYPLVRHCSVCLSIRLFIRPSLCLLIRILPIKLSICLSVRPSVSGSLARFTYYPLVRSHFRSSVCPSGCLSVRLSVHPSLLSTNPSIFRPFAHPFVRPSVHMKANSFSAFQASTWNLNNILLYTLILPNDSKYYNTVVGLKETLLWKVLESSNWKKI